MRKLFQAGDTLQLSVFRHIKYYGTYKVGLVSEQEFTCILGDFSFHITAKELTVHYLQEDGFFLSCDAIKSIQLARL